MKRVLVLLLALAFGHALERGRDYEKDKVCNELAMLGKDDFRSLSLILYSRKFPSSTFEQVNQLVKEVVSLTEECCAEGADPNCYDTRTSELSVKSCESDAPFPVHPGTPECCTKEGLERKLCMAALSHQPQEFPTYVEPTNDEICEAFRRDPKGFADQFLYEYSSNYGQAPLPLLVAYTKNYLSMVGSCCTSASPTVCFLKERLQMKHLSLLTTMSNRVCSQYVAYGKEKSRLSHLIKLAQKVPTANLENVLPLAEDFTEILSRCCESTSEDCMAREVKWSTSFSPLLPDTRYTFELSRRTQVPEVFLSKVLEPTLKTLRECCDTQDSVACFSTQSPLLKSQLSSFIEKGQEMCADYSENTFTEYKKKLAERLRIKTPNTSPAELKDMVEKHSDFASKCCSINSPPLYCSSQIDAEMIDTLQS
ncbi:vitamin D-binding protein [Mus caroli]|uniref:Vitamin D-binding protein n=1 Tax=Mus caroli TaxID=10089 RepID=A0A6P7R876_MUSCR|nr:vitamin D-binding protein [Mus caroli]